MFGGHTSFAVPATPLDSLAKSADTALFSLGPAVGNGWGLGPPGPRVPVEDILLFLLSKFGGRSWPGVRVAN